MTAASHTATITVRLAFRAARLDTDKDSRDSPERVVRVDHSSMPELGRAAQEWDRARGQGARASAECRDTGQASAVQVSVVDPVPGREVTDRALPARDMVAASAASQGWAPALASAASAADLLGTDQASAAPVRAASRADREWGPALVSAASAADLVDLAASDRASADRVNHSAGQTLDLAWQSIWVDSPCPALMVSALVRTACQCPVLHPGSRPVTFPASAEICPCLDLLRICPRRVSRLACQRQDSRPHR